MRRDTSCDFNEKSILIIRVASIKFLWLLRHAHPIDMDNKLKQRMIEELLMKWKSNHKVIK